MGPVLCQASSQADAAALPADDTYVCMPVSLPFDSHLTHLTFLGHAYLVSASANEADLLPFVLFKSFSYLRGSVVLSPTHRQFLRTALHLLLEQPRPWPAYLFDSLIVPLPSVLHCRFTKLLILNPTAVPRCLCHISALRFRTSLLRRRSIFRRCSHLDTASLDIKATQ